ncbi:MAG: nicotinamide phosphoribosyltransferase domain-containing protein, partial [Lachnospiraceae bacterium]|nr:nicotinamide phosphoribosyltransferase domain-containing protein [Lachnospiraceae bacterium]
MYNPLLLIDFYKATHAEQYPTGLTKLTSYYTPRISRLEDTGKVTFFGLQAFIKEYLIKGFNENFFNRPEDEVLREYNRVLTATLGKGSYDDYKIRKLHRLGYLPLNIYAVPEGMRTAIGVPQIEITNTHPEFVWLVNAIETMLSCSMWHTQVSAEVGYRYWQIVKEYWEKTCDCDRVNPRRLLGDFSMRGQQSVESAIKSSAAWCLSFLNTATVPAILWLEDNYHCDCTKEEVAYGAISTEHSVMCSNFAVDGDEVTHIKRLLTEIYPNHSFSMVSDSYDYWNLVDNILPQLKNEIMNHNGCISIRGDSGNPIEIIAGKQILTLDAKELERLNNEQAEEFIRSFLVQEHLYYWGTHSQDFILKAGNEYIRIECKPICDDDGFIDQWGINITRNAVLTPEEKGTVWTLWDTFGGTVNNKGYKVLDPHIKAIYGDSITPQRCEEIYRRLAEK